MKLTISWKRNTPSTVGGESITITYTYSSFNKEEIDHIQKILPPGIATYEFDMAKKGEKHD